MQIKTTTDYSDALTRLGLVFDPDTVLWSKVTVRDEVELRLVAVCWANSPRVHMAVRWEGRELCRVHLVDGQAEGSTSWQNPCGLDYMRAMHAAFGLLLEVTGELSPKRSMRLEGAALGASDVATFDGAGLKTR